MSLGLMKPQSIDTRVEAEEVLISLLREVSTAKKFSQIQSLSQTTIQLSRRAIARVNKDLTDRQIDILFVENHYGKEIAINLEKYLEKNEYENS